MARNGLSVATVNRKVLLGIGNVRTRRIRRDYQSLHQLYVFRKQLRTDSKSGGLNRSTQHFISKGKGGVCANRKAFRFYGGGEGAGVCGDVTGYGESREIRVDFLIRRSPSDSVRFGYTIGRRQVPETRECAPRCHSRSTIQILCRREAQRSRRCRS